MSAVESEIGLAPSQVKSVPAERMELPQPASFFAPTKLVKLCYTLVHAAEAVGIRDLCDGEFRPSDTTLEEGIGRQLNYLLDQVGCTCPGFRLLDIERSRELDGAGRGLPQNGPILGAKQFLGAGSHRISRPVLHGLLRHPPAGAPPDLPRHE